MPERDFSNDWDDPNNPYGPNRRPDIYNSDTSPTPGMGGHGYNPNGGPDTSQWNDGYGDPNDGIGSPESGYGVGGVLNPAYGQPSAPGVSGGGGTATGTVTAPLPLYTQSPIQAGGGNPAPASFLPPAAPMALAPQAPAPTAQKPPITDEVTKILMARLNELKAPGDLNNDPTYRNVVRAYQVASLRGADRERKALAERSAASGTRASGGFNVGVRGINERQGERTAQYTSGLALDRLQARESQLIEAIRMARAVGQDEIANQLEVQRLALQQELGRADLALRSELGRGQLDLGFSNLGFNYADLIQRANRDAVMAAL